MPISGTLLAAFLLLALVWPYSSGSFTHGSQQDSTAKAVASPQAVAIPPAPPPPPPDPRPRPVAEVLRSGVLIVISKKSQVMYVFKNGALWRSSPVSTGMRGHATPSGVFAILQKRVHHRSNKYSNAPMPFMQRLTWDGIAIHAGRLPGYPASHGCIRLPHGFAKELFAQTNFTSTTVVITGGALASEASAKSLALAAPMPRPPWPVVGAAIAETALVRLAILPRPVAAIAPSPVSKVVPGQALPVPEALEAESPDGPTVQFAAAESAALAEAEWTRLVSAHAELQNFRKIVVPATVNGRQIWRLRASGPDAETVCAALRSKGAACFNVQ